jgi:formamidopyrimidine-DNA glycosylase
MPEYPDVEVYVHCLRERVVGRPLQKVRVVSPFVVRTFDPPITSIDGKTITGVSRLGKQIVLAFEDDLTLVIHLMIAGRLRWKEPGAKLARKLGLAAFDFEDGTIIFTEAGSKKRAAIHLIHAQDIADFDRGGLEVFENDITAFRERLFAENHTLKRSLTDPRLYSGIGNAYSDEILLRSRLSPLKHSTKLSDDEIERLYHATLETLAEWKERLLEEVGDGFPDKVTAFHKEMATHGKFGEPCPVCDSPIQRIRYAQNECNYCATCQTDGKVLADRGLSRLLKQDWPRTLEELDELRKPRT